MEFERKTLAPQHYLYVERTAPMAGIGAAMEEGLGAIFRFVTGAGIAPVSQPISVYLEMSDLMRFRCGVIVSEADAARADGEVQADVLPTEVVSGMHVGPYGQLGQSHQALWEHMAAEGIAGAMPVWEVYVDDPGQVPEDRLRTEIYRAVA